MSGDIMNFGDDGITGWKGFSAEERDRNEKAQQERNKALREEKEKRLNLSPPPCLHGPLKELDPKDREFLEHLADEIAYGIEAQHAYKVPGEDEKSESPSEPQKFDSGKPPLALVFEYLGDSLDLMAQVAHYGSEKYPSIDNFQGHGPLIPEKYLSAALRHIKARCEGGMKDPESGLDHLGHALVSIAFVVWWDCQVREGEL